MAAMIMIRLQKLLGYFFELLYTRLAFLYGAVAWASSMGQWRSWQETALLSIEPGVILELGHGPGHLLLDLKQKGFVVIGLDPSRQMNRMAQRRLQKDDYVADIVRGQAQALPLRDGSIATLISTFPSNYIIDPATLSEAHRVLTHGGCFIIIGFIEITGTSIPDRFARWLYAVTGQSGTFPTGWEKFLHDNGFKARLEQVQLERSFVTRIVAEPRNP
jgi:ubiquinone/menaquinone biosynthesis C-methylase UbiE